MGKLCVLTIASLLLLQLAFAADSPSPSPSPLLGSDLSPHLAPTPDSPPAISPAFDSSPPAPSPSDLEQGVSALPPRSPAPSPDEASDINHSNINADVGEENTGGGGGGGGMSGGKKAGIVVAVVVAACLVGVGGLVYKKRQDNIRRSQYGYAARAELL
ncbi:Disulfide isomerase L-2 isoform 1 [Hibiscus syriacus]|uniref:Disulfide isomerase L-2 isoform 1 n=1 Tax=Hibiscus syriacus TaxID=106335 RepID=A0A6A3B866_HIBSY|nr:proline-rich receptor-like protein kinase PERK12 [Hibiscus syriacus]KAE8711495.1 Disulfide isomerase L-2 isoform 1 [Hibiscus syriacus]